jgi:hypothetical protein
MLAITSAAENCFSNISLSLHAATQKTKQQSRHIKVMILHINYTNFSTLVDLVFQFLVNPQLKKLIVKSDFFNFTPLLFILSLFLLK